MRTSRYGLTEAQVTALVESLTAGMGTDKTCAVDADATAGYIGASSSTGVLRTGNGLSYDDGGDFITVSVHASVAIHASAPSNTVRITSGGLVGIGMSSDPTAARLRVDANGGALTNRLSVDETTGHIGIGTAPGTSQFRAVADANTQCAEFSISHDLPQIVASFVNSNLGSSAAARLSIGTAGGGGSWSQYYRLSGGNNGWAVGIAGANYFGVGYAASTNPSVFASAPLKITTAGLLNIGTATLQTTAQGIFHQTNASGAIPVLLLSQSDEDFAFTDYVGTSAADATKSISSLTVATLNGYIRIKVNGTDKWIPYYNAPTA